MAAVAVGEGVDRDQSVMETDRELIHWLHPVLHLEGDVGEQGRRPQRLLRRVLSPGAARRAAGGLGEPAARARRWNRQAVVQSNSRVPLLRRIYRAMASKRSRGLVEGASTGWASSAMVRLARSCYC